MVRVGLVNGSPEAKTTMPPDSSDLETTTCLRCGFVAPSDSDQWEDAEHIALGTIPQCPECGSKTTTALSEKGPGP